MKVEIFIDDMIKMVSQASIKVNSIFLDKSHD